MIGAKAQPTNTLMPVLAKHKNFELRTGSWVRRIVHKDGRATGVQFTDANGEEFFQPAGTVILASFTLNNTRLLALSKIGTPYDPVTGKGTLGRNLTHQVGAEHAGLFRQAAERVHGRGSAGRAHLRFRRRHRPERGRRWAPAFGHDRAQQQWRLPIGSFGNMPKGASKSNWGSEWKAASLQWNDHSASIDLYGEHLSYRQNYMDLDPTYTDKFGDPLLRFTLDWTDHEFKQREFAVKIQAKIAPEMGAKFDETSPSRAPYNVIFYQWTHIQGGAIMGTSPEDSVVNRYLQHWDMPNLCVVGASAFPQNAAQNPTLTVLALTYMSSEAMIDRYFKHPERFI